MQKNLIINKGAASPLGLVYKNKKAHYALFSHAATKVSLALKKNDKIQTIPLYQTGPIWHVEIVGDLTGYFYAIQVDGEDDPAKGNRFYPHLYLQDPYARHPSYEELPWDSERTDPWSKCEEEKPFDWQGAKHPNIPYSELIIYEMHVRSFTTHPSSQVQNPGTYLGLIEKIPYLKSLHVNAIELMPVFSFDETHNPHKNPETGERLFNFWGYSPMNFFAPTGGFGNGNPYQEFKALVRECHKNGIEVILDVVYNHSGEGKIEEDPFHFRGIDNNTYYMVDEKGHYRDYTGCSNTINSNQIATANFIIDSLKFWVKEMHVDGFRFDLAAVHTRGTDGKVLAHPPLLQKIAEDEDFHNIKLIAEGWDITGLYLVGTFPQFGPWSVWNGKFRDTVRNFIKGTDGFSGKFADALSGSESLYAKYTPLRSINFITAHDGFTLKDLVSYNQKHNLANGESNNDGNNTNFSWNSGVEGPTDNQEIIDLREKQERNFLLSLFLSQGVPMLFMGDEYGHTRNGNNNPYCQDNDLNWFLWDKLNENKERFDFVSSLIAFRKSHPILRMSHFLTSSNITWQGQDGKEANWDHSSRFVAYTLNSTPPLYIAFNANFEPAHITLPSSHKWTEVVSTAKPWKEHNFRLQHKDIEPNTLTLEPYSAIVLQGNKP